MLFQEERRGLSVYKSKDRPVMLTARSCRAFVFSCDGERRKFSPFSLFFSKFILVKKELHCCKTAGLHLIRADANVNANADADLGLILA